MLSYALRRLIIGVLVMFVVSGITFTLTNAAIDPARAIAGEGATSDDVEAIRKSYGFDRPLAARYVAWLGQALQGDLGSSYRQRRPVVDVIMERLPVTLKLGGLALAFALVLSIPLAIAAALRPNSWIDRIALLFALFGQAMPTFWFALLGIVVFSVNLRWLPASGSGTTAHFILPAIALGYYAAPTLMRLMRAGMIDVLASDYIRTARAKGLSEARVVLKHALRNAVLPVVSVAAVQFGFMLGGSVVIETIFAMQGVGYLAWESISLSDLPVTQAIVLMISLIYIVLTLSADLLNAWLDPRIRIG
ncbi:ABC transporter permease [Prosthecomicrobium hirschii]|uniref:ABC transporter permease n=1 Tax=Prosthecodimorpha hirschii TaxID=665126 RepID=A0A0P6W9A1_9HYPH|nr:ABC transporter permease [Prosthecomicrobium hirschii]KPL55154.1 ABC transporter permease [Prosthecomicrobium hirschii]MCW1839912.1 ABC transporter permease [Prosthecomicrobium hirschii]TPQ52435.1 ABC transporter permease [Prosthecomicrobium hirschii]